MRRHAIDRTVAGLPGGDPAQDPHSVVDIDDRHDLFAASRHETEAAPEQTDKFFGITVFCSDHAETHHIRMRNGRAGRGQCGALPVLKYGLDFCRGGGERRRFFIDRPVPAGIDAE